MAFKDKLWIIGLIGAIVALVGAFLPYLGFSISIMGYPFSMYLWLFGFAMMELGPYGSMSGFAVEPLLMTIFILLLAGAVLALVFSILVKQRENKRAMGIVLIIAGALILIAMFVPIAYIATMMGMMYGYMPLGMMPIHVGFYLPLIGGILVVVAGIAGVAIK